MNYYNYPSRHAVKFIVSALMAVYIQELVGGLFLPEGLVPQLLLGWIIFLAFYWPRPQSLMLAFFIGLLIDFVVAKIVGPGAVMAVFVCLMLSAVSARLYLEAFFVKVCCGYFSAMIFISGYRMLLSVFQGEQFYLSWGQQSGFILTALLIPLIIKMLKRSIRFNQGLI